VESVRLAPGLGQAASHLIVEFLGGAKFQVMREAAVPRLHHLRPASRTVTLRQESQTLSSQATRSAWSRQATRTLPSTRWLLSRELSGARCFGKHVTVSGRDNPRAAGTANEYPRERSPDRVRPSGRARTCRVRRLFRRPNHHPRVPLRGSSAPSVAAGRFDVVVSGRAGSPWREGHEPIKKGDPRNLGLNRR
jgi:hypothetical protein